MTGPVSHQAAQPAQERALVQRCQQGDRAAFDALVRLHQQEVFAVAMRMLGDYDDAQDIAQDVFVRAFQAIGSFRQEAKVSTWLVSITMNLCRNRRRWWARRKRVIAGSIDALLHTDEGELAHDAEDPSPGPEQQAQRREQQQQLLAALQLLDESARSMIVLRDLQGYSYEEIADTLGTKVGTVKSRLNRARLQLRARMDGAIQ